MLFIREIWSLAASLDGHKTSKMADGKELQTNLTEYRAQLRQASFFRNIHSFILSLGKSFISILKVKAVPFLLS